MPPYGSGKGVISGLKSNTHKGKGYNEISLDDTAGKENITVHGQYDMNTTVEHDHPRDEYRYYGDTYSRTHPNSAGDLLGARTQDTQTCHPRGDTDASEASESGQRRHHRFW